jgi:flagellar basal-body rod protein FlgC
MFDAMEVLASGLSAARMRVNVLSSNVANAETTRTPEGGPYKRRDVVQVARNVPGSFESALDKMTLARPQVTGVVEDNSEPRKVHQPGHPDADAAGYVSYPNISVVTTMTDLMSASRLYQANVSALDATRQMITAAQQISLRG